MTSAAKPKKSTSKYEWIDPYPTMEEYLLELQILNKHVAYIRTARTALLHFTHYCRRQGIENMEDVTRNDILGFQQLLNTNTAWTEGWRTQIMKLVRTYFNWQVDVGHLTATPFIRIRIIPPVKMPNPLTDDELELLMSTHRRQAHSINAFSFHRREMILAVLFAWGLRVHEAAALNVEDFNVNNDSVLCINKGGGTKRLPYTDELKVIFARYSRYRAAHAEPHESALFISNQGERITKEYISKIISDLGVRAGIDINAHMLRDTCGTNLLDANVPVERVAKILGHANVRQTLQYSEVRDKKVAEDLSRAMNPKLRQFFGHNTRDLKAD